MNDDRRARCPRCGRPNVRIERRDGEDVLVTHTIHGGTATCYRGSGQPVQR